MSDIFDHWKEQKDEIRRSKAVARQTNKELFEEIYNNMDDYLVEKRSNYHFSLYLNGERVDYWPTSGKAKNITRSGKFIKTDHPKELISFFKK